MATAQASHPTEPMNSRILKVMTFNMLCPQYFRASGSLESKFPGWRRRMRRLLQQVVLTADADIVGLQEVWIECDEFRELLESIVAPTFEVHYMRRTHGKCDGVATLLRKGRVAARTVHAIPFLGQGNRVCLRIDAEASLPGGQSVPLCIANTHLTFPHDEFDRDLQLRQAAACISRLPIPQRPPEELLDPSEFFPDLVLLGQQPPATPAPGTPLAAAGSAAAEAAGEGTASSLPTLFMGDFNLDSTDAADSGTYQLLTTRAGLGSAFAAAHDGTDIRVSHVTHRNTQRPTDFIFTWPPLPKAGAGGGPVRCGGASWEVAGATLLPESHPADAEMPRPVADLEAEDDIDREAVAGGGAAGEPLGFEELCRMTDHRPLLVSLRVQADA